MLRQIPLGAPFLSPCGGFERPGGMDKEPDTGRIAMLKIPPFYAKMLAA